MQVHLFHIFFIGPLLIYIGLIKPQTNITYNILLGLSAITLLKFTYLLATQTISQKSVWYIIHVVLFAVLTLHVGIKMNKTSQIGYSLLLATGIAACGYHLLRQIGFK